MTHESSDHIPPTSHTTMSLLQDVLRHQTLDSIERRFDTPHPDSDNSDDELVNVVRSHSSRACRPTAGTDSSYRCRYQVHLHYLAQRPGQGRHHQEWFQDPVLANRSILRLVETPSRHSLHIYLRGFLGFWTFRTLQSALGCARSGAQANLSIMVNIIMRSPWGFCRRWLDSMVSTVSQGEF